MLPTVFWIIFRRICPKSVRFEWITNSKETFCPWNHFIFSLDSAWSEFLLSPYRYITGLYSITSWCLPFTIGFVDDFFIEASLKVRCLLIGLQMILKSVWSGSECWSLHTFRFRRMCFLSLYHPFQICNGRDSLHFILFCLSFYPLFRGYADGTAGLEKMAVRIFSFIFKIVFDLCDSDYFAMTLNLVQIRCISKFHMPSLNFPSSF